MNRNNISKAEINEKNRVLFKNLMNLKEKIKQQIEMNKQENYEAPSDEDEIEDLGHMEDDDLEPISDLKQRLLYTEQLNGIKFLTYRHEVLTREDSPPGRWRRVSADVLIDEWFNVTIQFGENIEENCPIFELKWNVEGSLARSELKPLVKVVQNDLYGLFTRLREYAILSRNRTELIQEFDDNFKRQFKIQRGENGVTLTWLQNLFQITWSMRYCEYTEEIINFFDIEINQNENDFKKASNQMFEKLLLVNQTIENRKQALMDIGSCATMYMRHYQ